MDRFSSLKIFADGTVNALLDRLYYELTQQFTISALDESFCLSGRAAAILQDSLSGSCNNIIFEVSSADIYSFIQNVLPLRLPNKGVICYKERTLYYFEGVFLEIWLREPRMALVNISGVIVRQYSEINPILL